MWVVAGFLSSYAGWAAVAFAMDRHHRQLRRRSPSAAARCGLRLAGNACLTFALVACVLRWGWAIGPVAWLGMLSATAPILVVVLAFTPRTSAISALLALFCACGAALIDFG